MLPFQRNAVLKHSPLLQLEKCKEMYMFRPNLTFPALRMNVAVVHEHHSNVLMQCSKQHSFREGKP